MGVIASRIKALKPKLDYILSTAEKINTEKLQKDLVTSVYDIFMVLKPFSHKFKPVCQIDEDTCLYVGEVLRLKSRYQPLGSIVGEYHFLEIIRMYGRLIAEEVRKPIRNDFIKLVELAEWLKPYNSLSIELDLSKPKYVYDGEWKYITAPRVVYEWAIGRDRVEIKEREIQKIVLRTCDPKYLFIPGTGMYQIYFRIDSYDDITVIEDLIDDLVELYTRAERIVDEVKRHNNTIIEKMREVVSPWMITKALKS